MATWHKAVSTAIDSAVDNPHILALHRRWCAARDAAAATPRAAAFDPGSLPGLAPNLMLLEAVEGDFIYRHYGVEIARHLQADMTGSRVSAFAGEIGQFFLDCYRRVVTSQAPLYTVHFSSQAPLVLTWERLLVPLKDATGRDWIAAYCEPMELRPKLLEAVLNATSDAILALRNLPGAAGQADDWLILVANADFATIMGVHSGGLVGMSVAEAFQRWRELGLEENCRAAVRSKTEHHRELDISVLGDMRHFSAYFGPLGNGCVVRLTEVTALKRAESALRQHAARLQSANAQLEQLAAKDGLTGLFNRRSLDTYLDRELAHARRTGEGLTLALCDIDDFKAYNDHYGHMAGDDVICEVAAALATAATRAADMAARFGGEEFVLVMRQTTLLGGLEVVHRALDLLRQRQVKHCASSTGDTLTLSFGVAEFAADKDNNPADLLARADAALYRAKQNGRNRIEVDE